MIRQTTVTGSSVLRLGGAFIVVFSVVASLLLLFAIPSSCRFVSGLQLTFLGFFLIAGLLVFLAGQFKKRLDSKKHGIISPQNRAIP